MGLLSTLIGILGFCIGLPFGLLLGFFFLVYSKPKDVKEPVVTSFHEWDSSTLQDLMPEIPNWIKSPDYERVDWLNKFMLDLWPYLQKAICNTIRITAKPVFAEYIGKYQITEIEFENLDLGTLPPTFYGMKVYETNENQLVLEPAIRWAGNPNIVLAIKLMSTQIRFQLVDLQIFANPRIHLKPLVPTFPCFANIVVSLMEKPQVDFGLRVMGGDIMSIPGLYRFVQETIKKQVSSLYHWPQSLEIPILDTSTAAIKKPVGILHVKVIRASKLLKMDFLGTSDPYVKLRLSGEKLRSKRTSIKMRNLNPEWNEDFRLIVKDPETQILELQVYDWDKAVLVQLYAQNLDLCPIGFVMNWMKKLSVEVGGDDKLGVQVIPLKLLSPHEAKSFSLDLLNSLDINDHHNRKQRGKLVVELTFAPFRFESDSFKGSEDENSTGNTSGDEPISEAGALLVTIISAKDIEGEHHTNPYVQILFRGERRKTKTIKKNRNPRWNEHFEFMIEEAPLHERLHVEIFSKRRTFGFHRKESLGFVDITLADVVYNGRINEKYHLINSQNGLIHLLLEWQTV